MGVSRLGLRVYLDTSSTIHTIEDHAVFPNLKAGLIEPIDRRDLVAVTSELTLLETLVKPRELGDMTLETAYLDFLRRTKIVVRPIDAAVLERAIDLRILGLKTPDAIHVATGLLEGCDVFLTRDKDWSRAGIAVVDPADVA